jgi:hypothetical protein
MDVYRSNRPEIRRGENLWKQRTYLGEVMSDNRLFSSRSKKDWVRGSFAPRTGGSYGRYANYVGYVMYAGYEDFPGPDNCR